MVSNRDRAARYLDLVVRLLPAAHSQWGEAMRAELATIEEPSDRRRFALGCTRVALLLGPEARGLWGPVAVAGAVSLMLGAEIELARAIGQTVPLALALALLAWLGRRPGLFGPVRPDRASRAVRAGGYALVGACLLALVVGVGASGLLGPDPMRWGPFFVVLLTVLAAGFLAFTALPTRCGSAALVAGAAAGVVAGLAAFATLPFERVGAPLAGGGRWWLALVAVAAPAAAVLLIGRHTRRADQAMMAALCAGTVATLLVALLGLSAIVLFPHSVPDIVGPVMPAGSSAAAKQAENVIEASDPYFGWLLLSALLAALLWAMARPPVRAVTTRPDTAAG
jgi:hypothetical protein